MSKRKKGKSSLGSIPLKNTLKVKRLICFLFIMSFVILPMYPVLAQEANEPAIVIPKKPVVVGEKIYLKVQLSKGMFGSDFFESFSYVYRSLREGSVYLTFETEIFQIGGSTDRQSEDLFMPLNWRKQTVLKTFDGKQLLLTVDEYNRLLVEELIN